MCTNISDVCSKRISSHFEHRIFPVHSQGNMQAGRWLHAYQILLKYKTSSLVFSDIDVLWLRDPRKYFETLEGRHPWMNFANSTDENRPLDTVYVNNDKDMDIEASPTCCRSMNIGIIYVPTNRTGVDKAFKEASSIVARPENKNKIDQGVINKYWKGNSMSRIVDHADQRLCAILNSSSSVGILPIRQFCNFYTYLLSGEGANPHLRTPNR